jgi:hypothetical protein
VVLPPTEYSTRREVAPVKPGPVAAPPDDRSCDIELPRRVFSSWTPSNGSRAIVRALTDEERQRLARREAELAEGLRPFSNDQAPRVRAAIAKMLGGFRSMRQQGADVVATVEAAVEVLAKFPAWAIQQGCFKIARREAGLDPSYAPHDNEIFHAVEEIVKPYRKALANAKALLDAPVEPDESPREKPKREPLPAMDWSLSPSMPGAKPSRGDGNHMARVLADLEARRARRELGLPASEEQAPTSKDQGR